MSGRVFCTQHNGSIASFCEEACLNADFRALIMVISGPRPNKDRTETQAWKQFWNSKRKTPRSIRSSRRFEKCSGGSHILTVRLLCMSSASPLVLRLFRLPCACFRHCFHFHCLSADRELCFSQRLIGAGKVGSDPTRKGRALVDAKVAKMSCYAYEAGVAILGGSRNPIVTRNIFCAASITVNGLISLRRLVIRVWGT